MTPVNIFTQHMHFFTFTEVQEIFLKIMREEEDVSAGVAAIRTLLTVIENYKGIHSTTSL